MRGRDLHRWDLPPREAIALQERLRERVERVDRIGRVRRVAGVDIGLEGDRVRAAVVVLEWPRLDPLEQQTYEARCTYPYVPGLLSFREMPAIIGAMERLKHDPDLVLVDAQGVAHPRRFGSACHLGVWFDVPTIGVAKSRLCGTYEEPGPRAGEYALLEEGGEVIGAALRTKDRTRVVYVSIGHRVSLRTAIAWTKRLTRGFRLPEPTRRAHQASQSGER